MIPSLQPNHTDLVPIHPLPPIPPPRRPQRHLQRNLHPGTPVIREEDARGPAFPERLQHSFREIERGGVGARGEEDVAVSTGGFGCCQGEFRVGVGVCLATRTRSEMVCGDGAKTHVNQLAEPSNNGFNKLSSAFSSPPVLGFL